MFSSLSSSLSSSQFSEFLHDVLEKALKRGADEADVLYVQGTSVSVSQRNQEVEELERSEGNDLGLRVFVGKRQAVVSTSDLSEKSLSDLLDRAISMAKMVPEDPFCGLASREEVAHAWGSYETYDNQEDTADFLIHEAHLCEEAALSVPGISKSEGVSASWGKSAMMLVTSHGFKGEAQESGRSLSVSMIAEKNKKMERDYASTHAIFRSDMLTPKALGIEASERTLRRLLPRKISSMKVPIIFDPRVGSSFLEHFASAINGASVARGTTFLKDALNHSLFSKEITILDDPHKMRGLRSRPFDAEGILTFPRSVVEEGVLKTWILDLRSARQLGLKTTGNASRSPGGIPYPSVSNFYMKPGLHSPHDLIGGISKGLYVTELIGDGVNLMTGDYSRGAVGFFIEKGELTFPVSEITIAGNLKDMFQRLSVCNDLTFRYGIDVPTLMIEGMTIAGV